MISACYDFPPCLLIRPMCKAVCYGNCFYKFLFFLDIYPQRGTKLRCGQIGGVGDSEML